MTKKKKNDPYDLCAIYDVSEPIPEEFIDPDDLEPTLENTSVYVIERMARCTSIAATPRSK